MENEPSKNEGGVTHTLESIVKILPRSADYDERVKKLAAAWENKNTDFLGPITTFIEEREAEVAKINSSLATLALNVEIAYLYRDMGNKDAAYHAFCEAIDQATQEDFEDLKKQLEEDLEKLDT